MNKGHLLWKVIIDIKFANTTNEKNDPQESRSYHSSIACIHSFQLYITLKNISKTLKVDKILNAKQKYE